MTSKSHSACGPPSRSSDAPSGRRTLATHPVSPLDDAAARTGHCGCRRRGGRRRRRRRRRRLRSPVRRWSIAASRRDALLRPMRRLLFEQVLGKAGEGRQLLSRPGCRSRSQPGSGPGSTVCSGRTACTRTDASCLNTSTLNTSTGAVPPRAVRLKRRTAHRIRADQCSRCRSVRIGIERLRSAASRSKRSNACSRFGYRRLRGSADSVGRGVPANVVVLLSTASEPNQLSTPPKRRRAEEPRRGRPSRPVSLRHSIGCLHRRNCGA